MPTGKVKWFNPEMGFGFLAREDGPDVFVHKDALPAGTAELKPGQRVEFGIVAGRRGRRGRGPAPMNGECPALRDRVPRACCRS